MQQSLNRVRFVICAQALARMISKQSIIASQWVTPMLRTKILPVCILHHALPIVFRLTKTRRLPKPFADRFDIRTIEPPISIFCQRFRILSR